MSKKVIKRKKKDEVINTDELMKIARDFENDLGLSFEESYRLAEESLRNITLEPFPKVSMKEKIISNDLFSSEEIKKLCTLDPSLQSEALNILYEELLQYEQGSNARPDMDYVIGLTIDRSNERKKKVIEQMKILEEKRNEKKQMVVEEDSVMLSLEERKRRIRESWNKQN